MPRIINCVRYDKRGRRHFSTKTIDTIVEQDILCDKMCELTRTHEESLTLAIRKKLTEKSPLRKYGYTTHLDDGEFPIIGGIKKGYYASENGFTVEKLKLSKVRYNDNLITIGIAPLVEIASNPEFEWKDVKKTSFNSILKKIIESNIFLTLEQRAWDNLQEKIPGGHVRCFIRTDVTALSANDPVKNRLGFSIFENIAVVITV